MHVEEDSPPSAPAWIVTYGDMMSLLLTFFILLVSMSEVRSDNGKYRAMMDALHSAFGPDYGKSGAPGTTFQASSLVDKINSLGTISNSGMKKSNLNSGGPGGPYMTVERLRDGSLVTLGGPVAFGNFSADLSPELQHDLDVIADVIWNKPLRIEVRGHASPEPIPESTGFRDAFDLSFARAQAVSRYLVSRGIAPHRLLVSAAGDTEPRRLTRAAQAQATNHRVDVFLRDAYIAPGNAARDTGP
jgi:chemotaxis protein MotB